jgi:hypothetical protein
VNARNFSSLILYTSQYENGARRFDVGERSNFALLPAGRRIQTGMRTDSESLHAANHMKLLKHRERERNPSRTWRFLCTLLLVQLVIPGMLSRRPC